MNRILKSLLLFMVSQEYIMMLTYDYGIDIFILTIRKFILKRLLIWVIRKLLI